MKKQSNVRSIQHNALIVIPILLLLCLSSTVTAQSFEYKYELGQKLRIVSEIYQLRRFNGQVDSEVLLLNKILSTVDDMDGDRAHHSIVYQHSVENYNASDVFQFSTEYYSDYWRDPQGLYDISPEYFVPTVINAPVFPDRDLEVGESWSHDGYEIHDFRPFGVEHPYTFPIPVNYSYEGKFEFEGKEYDLISMEYNIFHRTEVPRGAMEFPSLVYGFSRQKMLWNQEAGRPEYYEDEYDITIAFTSGMEFNYSGTAWARVYSVEELNREELRDDIEDQINDLGLEDVDVRADDLGVTLSLENIQFLPDSTELVPGEVEKLDRVAEILLQFPERDILVSGHTALAGTEEGRQSLSEERARVIGQYLLDLGVRSREQIMFQGFGARRPIADNDSPEGRRRNRRVEITILEH